MFGLVLAVFTADVISHILYYERMLTRAEVWQTLRTTFGGLWPIVVPFLLLIVSWQSGWSAHLALYWSAVWLITWLVFIGYSAARKASLSVPQRLVVLGAEAVLAASVIALKVWVY